MIHALDAATGETRWEKPRDEQSNWSTPLIVEAEGRTEVVVNGTTAVISYDLATGDVLWTCAGQTANPIPSLVAGHGMIYAMSGFRGSALYAVKQGATGKLDGTDAVAWTLDRGTPYVPSPLLLGDNLYFMQGNDSRLSCVNAKDGTVHYSQERLEGLRGGYASAVAAAGRIYLVDRDGNSLVLNDGPTITVAAANRLDDRFTASPAIVGTEMFLRGHRHLYCIANP
jgi:outer membrane protein assembly factor BamB